MLVRHHGRSNVMILDERLAEEFLIWLAERPADALATTAVGSDVMAEARAVAQESEAKRDRELVELLEAKFGVRRPRQWTPAHTSILIGEVPEDRAALYAVAEEYADVETPWWYKY